MKLEEIIGPRKILIVLDNPETQILNEATRVTVRGYTARRDPPHFQGDEYHAHVDLPGGYEVGWSISGERRHPNKFPAQIPNDAKLAVAKVLGVDHGILESFGWHDDVIKEDIFIVQISADALALGLSAKGPQMFRYLITTFRTPQFDPTIIEAHYVFLDGLRARGQLELAGPFTDKSGGAYLIKAANLEEAQAIAFTDPVHTSKSSIVTVYEWNAK